MIFSSHLREAPLHWHLFILQVILFYFLANWSTICHCYIIAISWFLCKHFMSHVIRFSNSWTNIILLRWHRPRDTRSDCPCRNIRLNASPSQSQCYLRSPSYAWPINQNVNFSSMVIYAWRWDDSQRTGPRNATAYRYSVYDHCKITI